jgi:hypothetical protein
LIDVPAVRLKEVLVIGDVDCHSGEFVCIKRKKEAHKADEKWQISSAYAEL